MGFNDVISMIGAIALFLFGMNTMSDGLEKLSSGRLEIILEKMTNNVVKGVLLGALVTGLIQSSAATTVMCVGFVNAGIMKLSQTVGIIMGANIGTTVTAQLLRLSDISSDNPLMMLLDTAVLGPILAAVGIILFMFISGGQKKNIGQIALGLGVLFIGMETMTGAVAPLRDLPEFQQLFVAFSNPVIGIIVGALVTALIQSSSASMGILQAVSSTGVVTFGVAAPLIFGQNIGTCITAILSSIGASKNAKRTALLHLTFNMVGTIFFMVVLYAGNMIFHFAFWDTTLNSGLIANLHSGFNIACTVLLLPFHKLLVRLVEKLVPGESGTVQDVSVLDERFLSMSPSVAMERSHDAVIQMGHYAHTNYHLALELLEHFDAKKLERVNETECALDRMETALDNYLVKLTDRGLSPQESNLISELLHTLSDFERIGDYVVNVTESAQTMAERGLTFSEAAKGELDSLTQAVGEILDLTIECYVERSAEKAKRVEPLEEVIDLMRDELRNRHIERLKSGECTIEVGTQFLELLINLERVADHCSNIAMYIIRETARSGDIIRENSHIYFHDLHKGGNDAEFDLMFRVYRDKYLDALRPDGYKPAPDTIAPEAGR